MISEGIKFTLIKFAYFEKWNLNTIPYLHFFVLIIHYDTYIFYIHQSTIFAISSSTRFTAYICFVVAIRFIVNCLKQIPRKITKDKKYIRNSKTYIKQIML